MDYNQYTIYIERCDSHQLLDNIYNKIFRDCWLDETEKEKLLRIILNKY